jgi:hypothetical protein
MEQRVHACRWFGRPHARSRRVIASRKRYRGQGFERLTTAAVVVTVVLIFAVPFVLALIAPFIGR